MLGPPLRTTSSRDGESWLLRFPLTEFLKCIGQAPAYATPGGWLAQGHLWVHGAEPAEPTVC